MVSIFIGGGILVIKIVEHDLRIDPLMALIILVSTSLHYVASYYIILKSEEQKHVAEIIRMVIGKVKRLIGEKNLAAESKT
jgi:uncharacterized LabA/DUF88 family protein